MRAQPGSCYSRYRVAPQPSVLCQAARFQKKLNELSRAVIPVARQFLVSNADRLLMDFSSKVVKFEWPTILMIVIQVFVPDQKIQVFVDFGFQSSGVWRGGMPSDSKFDGSDMSCKFLPAFFQPSPPGVVIAASCRPRTKRLHTTQRGSLIPSS